MPVYYQIDTAKLRKMELPATISTHKEMCELLDEPYSDVSSAIKAKEKNWARFFRFGKSGRAYTVFEVYDSPSPIPFRANDFYSPRIWRGIAYALRCMGVSNHPFTWTHLLRICGFVGLDYGNDAWLKKYAYDCKYGYKEAEYHLYTLENNVREFSKNRLKDHLKSLSEKGYIQIREEMNVVTANEDRIASDEERLLHDRIVADYLKEAGHTYLNRYDWGPLNKILKDKMGIADLKKMHKTYDITLLHDPFKGMDDTEAEGDAFESILSINEKSLAYVRGKVGADVMKSTFNYINWSFGYDYCGPITMAPKKRSEDRIADRLTLISMYVDFDPRYYANGKSLDGDWDAWNKWNYWCDNHQ